MVVHIDGVTLHLAHPDELPVEWVGQDEAMRQLLAAWMVVNEQDLPMNPRLLGKPGVGKTTLAYAAGRRMVVSYPYVPVAGAVRIVVAIFSYDGHLAFGVTGDHDAVPDIDVLCEGIERGIEELLALA